MHEFSLFLFKNWLPVGFASIFFFLVGMLIAKFIWGRYAQRLSFAVEENLNLASQWNALGASQRDLFKKLRIRWQEDRDAWESRLTESEEQLLSRETRIAQLTGHLEGSGKEIPAAVEVDGELRREVAALRAELESKDAALEELQAQIEEREEMPLAATLPLAGPASETASSLPGDESELQVRIRELEQDLIDTHDELHEVRTSYRQQSELVETLEARLIEETGETPTDEAPADREEKATRTAEVTQLSAILQQRGREIEGFRREVEGVRNERDQLERELENALDRAEFEAEAKKFELKIADRDRDIAAAREKIAKFEAELSESRDTIGGLEEQLEKARLADRRRNALQAELNDAFHEMYDVRTALNERLDEIELLEACIDELEVVEEEKVDLEARLHEARRELSDKAITQGNLEARLSEQQAQREEFEAIIEDRGAEVDDLSAELRQKRDEVRKLKETLAAREGELEALTEESAEFEKSLRARQDYYDGQARRIADLEEALSKRYAELNETRSRCDEESKAARYHASRAEQVEAELERRIGEFESSDLKIATVEQALDEASLRISELTRSLSDSEEAIASLEGQLRDVSREKDETLRELERATRRIEELETATAEREQRIGEVEAHWNQAVEHSRDLEKRLEALQAQLEAAEEDGREGRETVAKLEADLDLSRSEGQRLGRTISDLERQIARLQSEVAEASERKEEAHVSINRLEAALDSNDSRVLELSARIEDQDAELDGARSLIRDLESRVGEREADLVQARQKAQETQIALQAKLDEAIRDRSTLDSARDGQGSEIDAEIGELRRRVAEHEASARALAERREMNLAEIERLRAKVSKRGESIRDLQNEVSSIMMQRADRDSEIALLKGKLRAVEAELENARRATESASGSTVSGSSVLKSLEAALQKTLSAEAIEGGPGTSLDDLPEHEGHHAPAGELSEDAGSVPKNVEHGVQGAEESSSDEPVLYFEEGNTELSDEARKQVDQLARTVRRSERNLRVSVIGFAGPEGSPEHSESLGARRADAVRERLLARGVAQSKVEVRSAGLDRRFSDSRARRVELVLAQEAMPESVN